VNHRGRHDTAIAAFDDKAQREGLPREVFSAFTFFIDRPAKNRRRIDSRLIG
jgi:hypothetical protein